MRVIRTTMMQILAGLIFFSCASWAQNPPAIKVPKSEEAQETIKVDVNVTSILFNVRDNHGKLLPNLHKEDFQVYEDGESQAVKYFTANSDLPLTLGILLDTSGSQANVLQMEKEVGSRFLKQIIQPKDLAFVISFDVNVDQLQDFTNDPRELGKALDKGRINTGGGAGGGWPGIGQGPIAISHPKGTLLRDAVWLASREKLARESGRKALILLTDGEDNGSKTTVHEAIEAAQKADTILYVLLCADRGGWGGRGENEMKKLTEETGGRVIDVGNKFEKLQEAFDQIANEMRSQYSLGYTPTNKTQDGSYRKLEIKSSVGKVQARKGYYAKFQQ